MTDALKGKLKTLIENGCTDSDLEYFASIPVCSGADCSCML